MFQKYKYVLAVYQEGSFTAAARKLFISQPSLSVAISNIEEELGMPLFVRYGTGVKPTDAGYAYIEAANKMRLAEDEFQRKFDDINELQTGKLIVGGSNYMASYMLPKMISVFSARFPNVEITLAEANSIRMLEMLNKEEVDMIIDNFEEDDNLYEKHLLAKETIFLCVPTDRPINKQQDPFKIIPENVYTGCADLENIPPVDISLFVEEKFVLLKPGNDMHRRAMAIFEERKIDPKVALEVDQLNISCALAESGVGACFVADTLFKYRKHTDDVALYKLNTQFATRNLYIASKKNRYCTRAMSEFIKVAQEIIKA